MKSFLTLLAFIALSCGYSNAAPRNVVIFLADDAGWGDYSQSGNTQVLTPHSDSIEIPGKFVMDARRVTLTLID